MKKLHLQLLLCQLVFSLSAHAKIHGNPANEIVRMINDNRTLHSLSYLSTSPGLGCMALQYILSCNGSCSPNNTINCGLNEDDFTEIFAPDCGVELPTFGTISGMATGCQSKYLKPSQAFAQALVTDKNTASLVNNKSFRDVGVGIVGDRKGPFFWCMLFSTDKVNSTFVLQGHGEGIRQRKGCFSGSSGHSDSCTSYAQRYYCSSCLSYLLLLTLICIYAAVS